MKTYKWVMTHTQRMQGNRIIFDAEVKVIMRFVATGDSWWSNGMFRRNETYHGMQEQCSFDRAKREWSHFTAEESYWYQATRMMMIDTKV